MRKILEAIVLGIFCGLLTRIAEQYLPENLKFLTETKIIWLLPAFLIALSAPYRHKKFYSIITAVAAILATGYTYYFSESIKAGNFPTLTSDVINFTALGLFAGAATGFLAFLSRSATNQFIRYGSMSLLPAIFTGDGLESIISTLNNFEFTPEIATKIFGGFISYALVAGKNKFKRKSLAIFTTIAAFSTLAYLYMV
jgi:hypothetical protein